ncbi:MAG: hypothetical protein NC935_05295, partial [Candidatus Omnitrophica bacterium]|nr:hypothetical protein [Candidatus Omnitrophota bacterium]
YAISEAFKIDYYNITWMLRDFLSGLPIAGGLSVNDTSGWVESGLSSETPILHPTPYGSWIASWSHADYGDKSKVYIADGDYDFTLYLESKVVHVWEARTDYVYYPEIDKIAFKSTLMRDGAMAGEKIWNETKQDFDFYTIAKNCSIEVYADNGTLLWSNFTENVSGAGFFDLVWNNTGLERSKAYSAVTQINTTLGGRFRTPFLLNIVPAQTLYNVSEETKNQTLLMVGNMSVSEAIAQGGMIGIMTTIMANQTALIETKMNQTVEVIQNASAEMQANVSATLASFENRTYAAVEMLQTGANQTLAAAKEAINASEVLEATAKKYSWSATVAPDPALVNDMITLSVQGPAGLLPIVDIYGWDNTHIIQNQYMTESPTTPGLYYFEFQADSRFTPGKAYTYIVQEPIETFGMVTGSGRVEAMSITTIAGLAAAAPEAERAAKKALDSIKAVEAVLVSGDNVNIALTLKNLKESVDNLPTVLAKEGVTPNIVKQINEIAERLAKIGGEEGFDFKELLEEALGESPAMKEVRSKTEAIRMVVELLLQIFEAKFGGVDTPIVSTSLMPGSIIFRVTAVNPSKTKKQTVTIKNYLPQEVKPKDVLDLGGLQLEYDAEKSIYYVYKAGVELEPAEIKIFNIEVEDVWIISDKQLKELEQRTTTILEKARKTEYFDKCKEIADTIYPRLKQISTTQADETVSRAQHIGIYRDNLVMLEQIKEDIARMEKILTTTGGPPAPELLTKTKIKAEEPSKTMTWIIIFMIIIFTSLLGAVLFFTWNRQAKRAKEELLAAKEKAFPSKESEEKKE